jgi:hypothetical protein
MKIGSSDISAIYAGTDEVQKIMLGTDEVYSAVALDWDTYENGVWQESPVHNTVSFYSTGNYTTYGARELKAPTTNASTWGDYIRSWWSYAYAPTAAMNSGYTFANADPYLGRCTSIGRLLRSNFVLNVVQYKLQTVLPEHLFPRKHLHLRTVDR